MIKLIFTIPYMIYFRIFPATVWPRCAAAHGDRWPQCRRPAAPPPEQEQPPRLPELPKQPRHQSRPNQSGRFEHVLRGRGSSGVNSERPPRKLCRGATEAIMAFVGAASPDGLLHFAVVSRHCSSHRLGLSQRRRAPAQCNV